MERGYGIIEHLMLLHTNMFRNDGFFFTLKYVQQ